MSRKVPMNHLLAVGKLLAFVCLYRWSDIPVYGRDFLCYSVWRSGQFVWTMWMESQLCVQI